MDAAPYWVFPQCTVDAASRLTMVPVQRLHTPSILHPLALSLCYAVSSPGRPSRSLCALAYSARGLRGVTLPQTQAGPCLPCRRLLLYSTQFPTAPGHCSPLLVFIVHFTAPQSPAPPQPLVSYLMPLHASTASITLNFIAFFEETTFGSQLSSVLFFSKPL